MSRTKIDYGIDLGTTNSAILRLEQGEVVIKKSLDTQKDTTPSAIAFNRKGNMMVGDAAYRVYRSDSVRNLRNNEPVNAFVEFKRTMGTDRKYYSSYLDRSFTSEELAAEILKRLKEYIQDEPVTAAVITVPAAFKNNQIEATRKAANLAGISYIEILQEPIAAAMAYGVSSQNKDGYWLVFDFGGGTFDAALLKVEEGIMKVIDTEGDNYLGGKNLDYAIVDKIIIPHIQEHFEITSILENDAAQVSFRDALKFYAEDIKNNLSFNLEYSIYVDQGDCGEDDNRDEIEIDLIISQDRLKKVIAPLYQKAIDCCLTLLKRNNLQGSSLESLILVGGPTNSPILKDMLEEQICSPDVSMDPMTAVSRGAALYASTVDLPETMVDLTRDKQKIQLELTYAASSVEDTEYVAIKFLPEKSEGSIPTKIYAEFFRGDNAWSSEKVELSEIGDVLPVSLALGKTNLFTIRLVDDVGNSLDCEPNTFNIIQGSVVGNATLPYNIGVEIQDIEYGKIIFRSVKGLEKNRTLPAQGVINGLKTPRVLRPGMKDDFIEISIYQGEHDADGTRAIHNHHVSTIYITGEDLPSILPKDSEVDINLEIDRSQKITGIAYFPYLDFEYEFEAQVKTDSIDSNWLNVEFEKAESAILDMRKTGSNSVFIEEVEQEIKSAKSEFEKNKSDTDTKQQALSNLRRHLKVIDKLEQEREWPDLEAAIKASFSNLEDLNNEKGNEQTTMLVDNLRQAKAQILRDKDVKSASRLIEQIRDMLFDLEKLEIFVGLILEMDRDFINIPWLHADTARHTIERGKQYIYNSPTVQELLPIFLELYDNGQFSKRTENSTMNMNMNSILRG